MSMVEREDAIRKEIQKLIKESCAFDKVPSLEFQKFHRALLRFSFDALSVELNYEDKTISVRNSKPSNPKSLEMGDFESAISQQVNYTDLEETLSGCVSIGAYNECFFRSVLNNFDRFNDDDEMKIA